MTYLRREARAALTFILEQGTTTASEYRQFAGLDMSSATQCFRRLLARELLTREWNGRSYIYSVANVTRAIEISKCGTETVIHETAEQAERAELLRHLPPFPLPCSFVFNLGVSA